MAFDIHALSEGRDLSGVEYQHGTLHGMEIREYLLAKWKRSCAYCGATGVRLNIDHIQPRPPAACRRVGRTWSARVPQLRRPHQLEPHRNGAGQDPYP
ncbi:hypothetical protein [Streptomyces sp. T028]|uniref:hypothetical protein n=1 Tax=Streptomyces sp. T028 TaxID=3394379 RepID=UPI003A87531C